MEASEIEREKESKRKGWRRDRGREGRRKEGLTPHQQKEDSTVFPKAIESHYFLTTLPTTTTS